MTVARAVLGESETLSYDELHRAISRQLSRPGTEDVSHPKPLAKLGRWLQNLLPGTDPFIKPWMIDLSDVHYDFDIIRPRTPARLEAAPPQPKSLPTIRNKLRFGPMSWYQTNNLWCLDRNRCDAGLSEFQSSHAE